jgi:hypothetical protein
MESFLMLGGQNGQAMEVIYQERSLKFTFPMIISSIHPIFLIGCKSTEQSARQKSGLLIPEASFNHRNFLQPIPDFPPNLLTFRKMLGILRKVSYQQ